MTLRYAPYKVTFTCTRTAEMIYTVAGTNGHKVAQVTADYGTERRMALTEAGTAAFRGFVQDVNQVVHYDGYHEDPAQAEACDFVRECLEAVARHVRGEDQ